MTFAQASSVSKPGPHPTQPSEMVNELSQTRHGHITTTDHIPHPYPQTHTPHQQKPRHQVLCHTAVPPGLPRQIGHNTRKMTSLFRKRRGTDQKATRYDGEQFPAEYVASRGQGAGHYHVMCLGRRESSSKDKQESQGGGNLTMTRRRRRRGNGTSGELEVAVR